MNIIIYNVLVFVFLVLNYNFSNAQSNPDNDRDLLKKVPIFWEMDKIPILSIRGDIRFSKVDVAVFSDGTIVWDPMILERKNKMEKDKTKELVYYISTIPKEKIDAIIKNLDIEKVFSNPGNPPNMDKIPLDSNNTVYITINTPEKHVQLISNHQQFEHRNTFHKHDNKTVKIPDGQTTYSLLLQEPFEYQTFRKNFDKAKKDILSLIPVENKNVQMKILTYRCKTVNPVTQKIVLRGNETDAQFASPGEVLKIVKNNSDPDSMISESMRSFSEKTKERIKQHPELYEIRE